MNIRSCRIRLAKGLLHGVREIDKTGIFQSGNPWFLAWLLGAGHRQKDNGERINKRVFFLFIKLTFIIKIWTLLKNCFRPPGRLPRTIFFPNPAKYPDKNGKTRSKSKCFQNPEETLGDRENTIFLEYKYLKKRQNPSLKSKQRDTVTDRGTSSSHKPHGKYPPATFRPQALKQPIGRDSPFRSCGGLGIQGMLVSNSEFKVFTRNQKVKKGRMIT